MANVEAFCAQQGNVLRKPLKFEGRLIKLDPRENVCRQLHEMWMRSGGRQMMYAEFKKRLRFKSTDDLVSVWMSWDSTPAIVAGLSGLGAAGLAAIGGYHAWRTRQGPSQHSEPLALDRPETWNDAPPGIVPPAFEYTHEVKNLPAYLVLLYHIKSTESYTEDVYGAAFRRLLDEPDPRHDDPILGMMKPGTVITKGTVESLFSDDPQPSLESFLKQVIPNQLFPWTNKLVFTAGPDLKSIYCGDEDLTLRFDEINTQFIENHQYAYLQSLTFDNGTVRTAEDDECRLRIPANSRLATDEEVSKFKDDTEIFRNTDPRSLVIIELLDPDLSKNLLQPRIEQVQVDFKSLVSRQALKTFMFYPEQFDDDDTNLYFILRNPSNLPKIEFDCPQIHVGACVFDLTCVAFREQDGDSTDIALRVDKDWIFYGSGPDPYKKPVQHLRKKVPHNNLSVINSVPQVLMFTKNQEKKL
jgi:hypothetical protein